MLNPKRLQTETEELLGHRGSKQNRAVRFKDLGAGAGGGLDEKAIQKIAEKKAHEVAKEYDGADVDLSEVHQRITHAEQVASGAAIEAANASSAAANAVTHADQAVDQARADLAVDYAATIAAATDAIDARDEAVVASTGAGNSAGAALTSSQQAGSSADEAASSAAASEQSRLQAEAARDDADSFKTTAGIARDQAVVARQDAETAAASAQVSLDMASQVAGRGDSVLSDQFLIASDWGPYSSQGIRTLLDNQLYPIGRTWQFDVTASQTAGIRIIDSPATIWPGQTNAAAYVIEVEYTLLSGSLQGAGVRLTWRNDTNTEFAAQFELSALQAGEGLPGRARTARGVFKRPSNFSGSFASHRLFAFANYNAWAMAAKSIQFHRINIRPATEEELGRGEVLAGVQAHLTQNYFTRAETSQAIAGADMTLNASLGPFFATIEQSATALAGLDGTVARFTNIVTVNGERRAGIEAVAFDGTPGGSGSVLKLIGDDVIATGTLSASRMVITDLSGNMLPDRPWSQGDFAGWSLSGQAGIEIVKKGSTQWTETTSMPSAWAVRFHPGHAGAPFMMSDALQVQTGQEYSLSVRLASGGSAPRSRTVQLGLRWYDENDTLISGDYLSSPVVSGVSYGEPFVLAKEAPAGAVGVRAWIRSWADRPEDSGTLYVAAAEMIRKRSGATLITPGSITTSLIAAEAIIADHIGAHEIRSSHLFIDERLEINNRNAGFAFGKMSLTDLAPGMFAGVGNTPDSFGINISRESPDGTPQQLVMTKEEKFKLVNVNHRVTMGSSYPVNRVTSTSVIDLPSGATTLDLRMAGGGAGGNDGGAGGNTIVKLLSNGVVVGEWVANGAAGSASGLYGENSEFGNGGQNGRSTGMPFGNQENTQHFSAGAAGAAAGGGGYKWSIINGLGGKAAPSLSVIEHDISDLINPQLEIVIGRGGAKGSAYAGPGGAGIVQFQAHAASEYPADVIPLVPSAFGTFSKPGNATGENVFPDLGIGLWVLSTNNNDNLDIGSEVEVTTLNHRVRLVATNHAIFFANKRPNIITGWGSARTIQYLFYRMGDWG